MANGYQLCGEIAAYYYDSKFISRSFVRDPNGEITVFDNPGAGGTGATFAEGTFAVGMNDHGAITGFYFTKFSFHGFIRWPDGRFTKFDVAPEVGNGTAPTSINSEGTVAGVFLNKDGQNEGFLRTPDGKFGYFEAPDGTIADYTNPYRPSINNKDSVAGWYSLPGNKLRGFVRMAKGDFEQINVPGGTPTFVLGINNPGEIVGFYENASQPYTLDFVRRPDGRFVTFAPPDSLGTQTTGINDKGQVIGWYAASLSETRGFLASVR